MQFITRSILLWKNLNLKHSVYLLCKKKEDRTLNESCTSIGDWYHHSFDDVNVWVKLHLNLNDFSHQIVIPSRMENNKSLGGDRRSTIQWQRPIVMFETIKTLYRKTNSAYTSKKYFVANLDWKCFFIFSSHICCCDESLVGEQYMYASTLYSYIRCSVGHSYTEKNRHKNNKINACHLHRRKKNAQQQPSWKK